MHERVTIPGYPELAADLYLPPHTHQPVPAVLTAPGFGGVKEMLIPHFARALAQAGIATLAVDYAGFGQSQGEPRQDVEPQRQIQDLRRALDWLARAPRIDPHRLGFVGTSMSGAHALVLAGTDPRLRAVVTMVPFVRAPRTPPSRQVAAALVVDTLRRLVGRPSHTIAAAGPPGSTAVMTTDGALAWIDDIAANAPSFRNAVTVRSLAHVASYQPMRMVGARGISVPVRAILSTSDTITPAALARKALRHLDCDIIELPGTHFELFGRYLDQVTRSTVEWLVQHLRPSAQAESDTRWS
ncbi:MAG: alpha/beta fold hydrolase [Polyangiales bacterium]